MSGTSSVGTHPTPSQRRRKKMRYVFGALTVLFIAMAVDYVFYPKLASVGGRSYHRGENGNWLRYTWYFSEEKESFVSLAQRLKQQEMRYAYFHVRFIKKSGELRYRFPAPARRLTREMHRLAPQTKLLAWIYVGNERGLTGVDISRPEVRKNMVQEAKWLVETCGFDGVQWDYEICENGNPHLLKLLQETRAALPRDKVLSVATAMWLPDAFSHWGWSEKYFGQIAKHCDQIAVMSYDSALFWPRHYVWLVRQQAIRVTSAVARNNPKCRVLIGIPTYEDGGPSHHLHAENITMALKGVREGLADANAAPQVCDGVAVFADYSTDVAEWETYRRLWLKG
jgi:hypothetical protein